MEYGNKKIDNLNHHCVGLFLNYEVFCEYSTTSSNIHQHGYDNTSNNKESPKSSKSDTLTAKEPQSFSKRLNREPPAFDLSSIDDILSGGMSGVGEEIHSKEEHMIQNLTPNDSDKQFIRKKHNK